MKAAILGLVLPPVEVVYGVVLDPTELSPVRAEHGKNGVAKARAFVLRMMGVAKPNRPQGQATSQMHVD